MQIHDDEWRQKTGTFIKHVLDDVGLDHLLPMISDMLAYSQLAIADGWEENGFDSHAECMAQLHMASWRHINLVQSSVQSAEEPKDRRLN